MRRSEALYPLVRFEISLTEDEVLAKYSRPGLSSVNLARDGDGLWRSLEDGHLAGGGSLGLLPSQVREIDAAYFLWDRDL